MYITDLIPVYNERRISFHGKARIHYLNNEVQLWTLAPNNEELILTASINEKKLKVYYLIKKLQYVHIREFARQFLKKDFNGWALREIHRKTLQNKRLEDLHIIMEME